MNIIKIPSFTTPKVDPILENKVQYSQLSFGRDRIINFQGHVYDKNSLIKDYHFNTVDVCVMFVFNTLHVVFLYSPNQPGFRISQKIFLNLPGLHNPQRIFFSLPDSHTV